MPRMERQKLKILYLKEYLERNTHEEKPVHTAQLIDYLQSKGIPCERKSIYSDIAALQEYGMDIEKLPGQNGGYYVASQVFELPELRLLIDAVQSSRFLTPKKSAKLIEKLCRLCNRDEESMMRGEIMVSGQVKNMNESIYYNVDTIQEAIGKNCRITFRYFDWGIDRARHFRNRIYEASPYALCWDHENYYLLAHSERHGITHYRVDRMMDIACIDVRRNPCPELTGSALSRYASQVFQMYAGEPTQVKLRFHNALSNVVIDRFGLDPVFTPDGPSHFTILADVAVSPMFLSWIMGFGARAQILHPQWVVQRMTALCQEILNVNAPEAMDGANQL